ncbi:MAG TPA: GNAT family N-acetyltransferase [Thermodesulfobacteriota bacterium]|nr:GNAT family N-acetyltransferase [Thermodesulfobacteriota bacterium]
MELKVFESPGQEWDEFASRYTDLIFYQSVWSEVLKEGLGGQPLYFYLREGGEIVAGLPGVLLNFRILKILYASMPYGNVIGEKKYFQVFMEHLEGEFVRRGIHQVRIVDSPFWEKRDPASNYKGYENICTLIHLRNMDEERLWKSYSHYVRRDIKRAQKHGIEIHKGNSKHDLESLYQLYLKAMERNLAPAKYSFQFVMALGNFMTLSNRGVLLIARMNQTPVAGILLIRSNSSTHAFLAGSDSKFLKFYPNKFLIHRSLVESIACGHQVFDFMGSEKEDENLIRFKNLWGGRPNTITTYVKNYNLLRSWIWDTSRNFINTRVGSKLIRIIRNRAVR